MKDIKRLANLGFTHQGAAIVFDINCYDCEKAEAEEAIAL
jgi:hypothetical protein